MLGYLVLAVVSVLALGSCMPAWVPWVTCLRLTEVPGALCALLAGPAHRRRLLLIVLARVAARRASLDSRPPPRPAKAPGRVRFRLEFAWEHVPLVTPPKAPGPLAHPPAFHPSGEVLVDRTFADMAEIIRQAATAPCWCGGHGEEARRWASAQPPR